MLTMFTLVLGTRPEIIKMSPIIRWCEQHCVNYCIVHTGQHYSYEMDRAFFEGLELPEPKYNLDVGSGTHAEQTGKIMTGIERILLEEKPEIVLVQGDTNTVLAGALAGTDPGAMLSFARKMLVQEGPWANPFGDRRAGDRVIQEVLRCF